MINVLLVHNTDLTNQEYKRRFVIKYKHFSEHPDVWKLTVIKFGSKLSKRNYDKIYYDEATVKARDLYDGYVAQNKKAADIVPVLKEGGRMKVNIMTKIKELK